MKTQVATQNPKTENNAASLETAETKIETKENPLPSLDILMLGIEPWLEEKLEHAIRLNLNKRIQSSQSIYETLIEIGVRKPRLVIVAEKILMYFGQSFIEEIVFNPHTNDTAVAVLSTNSGQLNLSVDVYNELSLPFPLEAEAVAQKVKQILDQIRTP